MRGPTAGRQSCSPRPVTVMQTFERPRTVVENQVVAQLETLMRDRTVLPASSPDNDR